MSPSMKEMPSFRITQLDWLEVKLRLHSLEFGNSKKMFSLYEVSSSDTGISIECGLYGTAVDEIIENSSSSEERLEYFCDWARCQFSIIMEYLDELPELREIINQSRDSIKIEIMHGYGMGSSVFHTILGSEMDWSIWVGD